MAEIKNVNGQTVVDYMARDYDSLLQSMRALIPDKLPEWTDYNSEADFGNVLLELFAHIGDILSYYQDRIANESFLSTAQSRRSIIHHLRLIGYRLSTAAPASTTLRVFLPAKCTDILTITKGAAFATKSQQENPSVRFEYTQQEDRTVDCNTLPLDQWTGMKYLDLPVEEGRLIKDEVLGISDGSRNQQFRLAHAGLILRSLGPAQAVNKDIILTTTLGAVIEEWTPRESLAFGREEQKDFAVEIDEQDRATVIFGDGDFGWIPRKGATIKATYRVGGGARGNVPANTIKTIVDASQLTLLGAKVSNSTPATGGAERESIDHAVQCAPAIFRSRRRAVTAEDYQALALDYKGVGKVRAAAGSWNTVTLYVAPEGGGYVSDVLRANLLAYFEDKRPITTLIEIENVSYAKIYVTALIGIKPYYTPESVREQVQNNAGSLLAFANVDFGQTLYLSKFYEAIEAIEGIDHVTITQFQRAEKLPVKEEIKVESSGKIELGVNEIARIPNDPEDGPDYGGGIQVTVEGET